MIFSMNEDMISNNGVPEAGLRVQSNDTVMETTNRVMPTGEVSLAQPKRKVDLSTAVLPDIGDVNEVALLTVRELKGIGATFTPNMLAALAFHGLIYRAPGEFESTYQILNGPLLHDPRLLARARRIAFVSAFDWSAMEVVLYPLRLTKFGEHVRLALQKLHGDFPNVKVFVQWSEAKKRHTVHRIKLTGQEAGIISQVAWPDRDQILEALSATAFDSLDDLAAANDEIRTLLSAREVE